MHETPQKIILCLKIFSNFANMKVGLADYTASKFVSPYGLRNYLTSSSLALYSYCCHHHQGSLRSQDMYQEVVPLCRRSEVLIREVFTNPDQVMGKFVLNIFQGQLQVSMRICHVGLGNTANKEL